MEFVEFKNQLIERLNDSQYSETEQTPIDINELKPLLHVRMTMIFTSSGVWYKKNLDGKYQRDRKGKPIKEKSQWEAIFKEITEHAGFAWVGRADELYKNFKKGTANTDVAIAVYYWLHTFNPKEDDIAQGEFPFKQHAYVIDQIIFEKNLSEHFQGASATEFELKPDTATPSLEEKITSLPATSITPTEGHSDRAHHSSGTVEILGCDGEQKQSHKYLDSNNNQHSTTLNTLITMPEYEDLTFTSNDTDRGNKNSNISLNPLNHSSIDLHGRENEVEQLNEFLNSNHPFQVLYVIGPSGAGKTRLTTQWLRNEVDQNEWQSGLVCGDDKEDRWNDWQEEPTITNTLIFVDYIGRFKNIARYIIEKGVMHAQKYREDIKQLKSINSPKIRLIILNRVLPENIQFRELDSDQRVILGETRSEVEHRLKYVCPPMYLNQFDENRNEGILKKIIRDASGFADDSKEVNIAYSILQAADNGKGNFSCYPLFAILIGQALKRLGSDNLDTLKCWQRSDLIDYYFTATNHLPWLENGDNGAWVGAGISAATAMKNMFFSTLFSSLPHAENLRGQYKNEVITRCNSIVSSYDKITLKNFEPDILGESFFLLFFEEFIDDKTTKEPFFKMLNNCKKQDEKLPSPIKPFIQFIQNTTRNLLNDDQNSPYIKTGLSVLNQFLNPDNFNGNESMRLTASLARIEVDNLLREKANAPK